MQSLLIGLEFVVRMARVISVAFILLSSVYPSGVLQRQRPRPEQDQGQL